MKISHLIVFGALATSVAAPRALAADMPMTADTFQAASPIADTSRDLPMRDLSRYADDMDAIRIPLANALALGVESRDRRVVFPDRDVGSQSRDRRVKVRDHRLEVFERETFAGASVKLRF